MRHSFIIRLLIILLPLQGFSQDGALGSWTAHLPYVFGNAVTAKGNVLFVGTQTGMYSYDTDDNSISRFSKVNRLSDLNVQRLKYNPSNDVLCLVYGNGNIDLIKGDRVINIPFISNSSIINKSINHILFDGDFAYLSFSFGIVKLNVVRDEIADTYFFGTGGGNIKVNSSTIINDEIFAATDEGVFRASVNSNLLDFNNWNRETQLGIQPMSFSFALNNEVYISREGENNAPDSTFKLQGNTWVLVPELSSQDIRFGGIFENQLLWITANAIQNFDQNLTELLNLGGDRSNANGGVILNGINYSSESNNALLKHFPDGNNLTIQPNGPFDKNAYAMAASNNSLWVVPGGQNSAYGNLFFSGRAYHRDNGNWRNWFDFSDPSILGSFDYSSVVINPEDEENVFIGTWGRGLLEFRNNEPYITYDDTNSALEPRSEFYWVGAGGMAFDDENRLWVTNSFTSNALVMRDNDGQWRKFNFDGFILNTTTVTDVIITPNGHKWINIPRDNGFVVFDDNGTYDNPNDDRKIKLTAEQGNGNIPGIVGVVAAIDKDGEIWIGTSDGPAVFFNPEGVFDGNRDAQRILIDDGENVEILLESVRITDIAVDGGNRKWLSTDGSGVYLLSEDGTEEIHHFTAENSPLLSNSVQSIAIDDATGEVYFGTQDGIISFRGSATKGSDNFSDVLVFPNPVREDYDGPIAIRGVMDNSTVKITDINGALVSEVRSLGGQAIWDGKNFAGEDAKSGVYLIFSSAEDEDNELKTHVGKILIINN